MTEAKKIADHKAVGLKPLEGAKWDSDKVRIELFPGDALFAISQVLTFGAKKYASRNWEKGISWGRVFGATMRHAWAWWQGKLPTHKSFLFGDLDEETKMSHLWHLGCCVVFLIAYEMRGMTQFDDRPKPEE
ncbi:MAG TPA: dATP/dGTP diphosphohydrolase domain-containing protein [Candidatus Angelobacter sp.]|nr:dATP/dGTP diphosphohydrolase domain-containing protein [Candidatus Angelobacter sp.]